MNNQMKRKKKKILTLMLALALSHCAWAEVSFLSDGDDIEDTENWIYYEPVDKGDYAPVGSGLAMLTVMAGGYAVLRRKDETKHKP